MLRSGVPSLRKSSPHSSSFGQSGREVGLIGILKGIVQGVGKFGPFCRGRHVRKRLQGWGGSGGSSRRFKRGDARFKIGTAISTEQSTLDAFLTKQKPETVENAPGGMSKLDSNRSKTAKQLCLLHASKDEPEQCRSFIRKLLQYMFCRVLYNDLIML